jgi:hypothetical protein
MYNVPTQTELNKIIAQAHAQRAGAFGRMIKSLFRR